MEPVGVASGLPPPKIIQRPGRVANWDYKDTPLSIINLETVKAVGKQIGTELDPRRFRGNLLISGLAPWQEFGLIGKRIKIGDALLEIIRPIDRCPAPGVNPETGERDIPVAELLVEHFGHVFCGMYAKVVKGGVIRATDLVSVVGDSEIMVSTAQTEDSSDYRLWPRPVIITRYDNLPEITRLSIKSANNWPQPEAAKGQRVRFHLAERGWTAEHISAATPDQYMFEVEKSVTSDPVTEYLRKGLQVGQEIVVSGPFGRIKTS